MLQARSPLAVVAFVFAVCRKFGKIKFTPPL
jgi:hypothetical protein